MAQETQTITQDSVNTFSQKLLAFRDSLDPNEQALLTTILANAKGTMTQAKGGDLEPHGEGPHWGDPHFGFWKNGHFFYFDWYQWQLNHDDDDDDHDDDHHHHHHHHSSH